MASALVLAACGGGGGGGGSSTDVVLTPAFPTLQGTASLRGTVLFPTSVNGGRAIQITIIGSGPAGSEVASGVLRTTGLSGSYLVRSLAAGTYKIRVRVDRNGNGSFTDSGDLDGYFAGTTTDPVLSEPAGATVAVAARAALTAVDFGIGLLPPAVTADG